MRKFTYLLLLIVIGFSYSANAQTTKGWFLIGGDVSNIRLDFQEGNTNFEFRLTPKVAWFIEDNFAVGFEALIGVTTSDGYSNFDYGVGPVGRYYFPPKSTTTPYKSRWFLDANVGLFGSNTKVSGQSSTNTNGLGFGFGPGFAYFLNKNIALEALAKYNLTVGFGNSTTTNSVNIGIGFQIYLPSAKLRQVQSELQSSPK